MATSYSDLPEDATPNPKRPAAPDVLKDTSVASLARVFNSLKEQATVLREPLRPALVKISEIVSKFQAAGLDSIGFEIATFDQMRDYNLMHQGKATDATYGILSMYNARYLVRIYPEAKIDCYSRNINKPGDVQYPDLESFWFQADKSGTKIDRSEPKFMPFDLKDQDEVLGFMSAIAQIGAKLAAQEELRSYDVPAKGGDNMPKAKALHAPKN